MCGEGGLECMCGEGGLEWILESRIGWVITWVSLEIDRQCQVRFE